MEVLTKHLKDVLIWSLLHGSKKFKSYAKIIKAKHPKAQTCIFQVLETANRRGSSF